MSVERTREVVVDTNVAIVANGKTEQAGQQCVSACITQLREIRQGTRVLLDDGIRILNEYRRNLNLSGQPGAGDRFFRWLWQNQANQNYCRKVDITEHDHRGFEEFPDDPDLESFDRDDRKFVAVALAGGTNSPVINASDTDWWKHREALQRNGIEVTFLCPELMMDGR